MSLSSKAFAVCLLSGSLVLPELVFADPSPGTPVHVLEAGEVIIDETYFMSEFAGDGSYFVESVRPDDSICTLRKTRTDYSKDDEEQKVVVTTYHVTQIDPERITSDSAGGVKLATLRDVPVFHADTIESGEPDMHISEDTIRVKDEETDVDQLINALKTMVTYCVTGN